MNTAVNNSILVVDDTQSNVKVLVEMLGREGYRVLVAREGESALEQARYAMPLAMLLDVMMPGIDGFEVCRRLKAAPATAGIPVIFMTALGDLEDKVKGFEAGGADYVVKPFEHEEVLARVRTHAGMRQLQLQLARGQRRAREQGRRTHRGAEGRARRSRAPEGPAAAGEPLPAAGDLRAGQPSTRSSAAARAAACAAPGRAGRAHRRDGADPRRDRHRQGTDRARHPRAQPAPRAPLVKLNCSAISAGLVESELFGHVKGAFTGATDRRVGRFELADGGTLFLDEVSELPLDTQAKLLRVLQEGEFEPVGSSKTLQVDVRVIAASQPRSAADVASGRFRADLYYRLNVFPIDVPPLRERRDDIPALAQFFMQRCARKLGKPLRGSSRHARGAAGALVAGQHPRPAEHDRARRDPVDGECCASTGRWTPGRKAASLPPRRKRRPAAPRAASNASSTAEKSSASIHRGAARRRAASSKDRTARRGCST